MGLDNQRLAITNGVFYASGRDDPTTNTIEVLGREAMASMPVSQAAALQDDLRRARIEPWAWVINKSVTVTGTTAPLLQARLAGERRQTERIANGLTRRTFVLPWLPEPPVGVQALARLCEAVKG